MKIPVFDHALIDDQRYQQLALDCAVRAYKAVKGCDPASAEAAMQWVKAYMQEGKEVA